MYQLLKNQFVDLMVGPRWYYEEMSVITDEEMLFGVATYIDEIDRRRFYPASRPFPSGKWIAPTPEFSHYREDDKIGPCDWLKKMNTFIQSPVGKRMIIIYSHYDKEAVVTLQSASQETFTYTRFDQQQEIHIQQCLILPEDTLFDFIQISERAQ